MNKRNSFVLAVALAVNLFGMVTPTMAQITVVLVPDVVGMSETEAGSVVQSAGFTISWTYQYSDSVTEGHVISQDPAAGTWAFEGSDVSLVVSLGSLTQPVYFADQDLKARVEAALGVSDPTADDMLGLTSLNAASSNIDNLTGLEYATNLVHLVLSGNQISDFSPLSGLTNLRFLFLNYNQISSISPLSGLTNLALLYLHSNQISNLSPLSGLTNLVRLDLYNNQISSISPLSGLTNLDGLDLRENPLNQQACDIYIPQMWANGTAVAHDDCVTMVSVPDVVGMADEEARSAIISAGFSVSGTYMYSDTVVEGLVISQDPSGGTSVPVGFDVNLVISLGPRQPGDGPPVPVPPDASCLVAHWKFDDGSGTTAIDSSGNGFDIMLHNTTWEDGVFGGAAHFQGVGYGDVSDFNYSQNAITLCAWVWHDEFRINKIERYVTVGQSIAAICKEYDGRLVFYIDTDDNLRHLLAKDVLTEGQWHHVAGTWDGLTQRLYIDGVEIASQVPVTIGVLGEASGVTISSEAEPFNGMLDDVRIYDCALSDDEINTIAGRLMAHWKLDETEGTLARDSAGENDGTVYGDPAWQPEGGMLDGALLFDGTDDYVNAGFVLNPQDGAFTVLAWIKGGEPGGVIVSQTDGSADGFGGTWLGTNPSTGKLITRLMFYELESEVVITDDQWHLIGLVWDGIRRYLYVDGEQVSGDDIDIFAIQSDGDLYLGAGKTLDAGSFFSGLIDDVRIYDVALSAEEIEELVRQDISQEDEEGSQNKSKHVVE